MVRIPIIFKHSCPTLDFILPYRILYPVDLSPKTLVKQLSYKYSIRLVHIQVWNNLQNPITFRLERKTNEVQWIRLWNHYPIGTTLPQLVLHVFSKCTAPVLSFFSLLGITKSRFLLSQYSLLYKFACISGHYNSPNKRHCLSKLLPGVAFHILPPCAQRLTSSPQPSMFHVTAFAFVSQSVFSLLVPTFLSNHCNVADRLSWKHCIFDGAGKIWHHISLTICTDGRPRDRQSYSTPFTTSGVS